MKSWLHLKTVLLLIYVALCTHMVLTAFADEPAPSPSLPMALGE